MASKTFSPEVPRWRHFISAAVRAGVVLLTAMLLWERSATAWEVWADVALLVVPLVGLIWVLQEAVRRLRLDCSRMISVALPLGLFYSLLVSVLGAVPSLGGGDSLAWPFGLGCMAGTAADLPCRSLRHGIAGAGIALLTAIDRLVAPT